MTGTSTPDAIVVGGGLVGAATAYELVRAGARTMLIDRHDPGRATDAGAGILAPETMVDEDDAWSAYVLAAGAHYRSLVADLQEAGAPDSGYAVCGAIRLALRDEEEDLLARQGAAARVRCGDVVRPMSVDDARAAFPALGGIRAAWWNEQAARVDGRAVTAAILHGARALGLEVSTGSVQQVLVENDRAIGVQTTSDRLPAGAVVVAGGAWSPAFARDLHVEIPVRPVRGQIIHLRFDDGDTGRWPILQPVLWPYAVPWPGGRIAVGATLEDSGFEAKVTLSGLRFLTAATERLAPGLAGATFLEARAGLRPVTVDDRPVVGPVPGVERAFVVTGHGAHGLLLGPVSGRVVADLILGRSPSVGIAMLGVARFTA